MNAIEELTATEQRAFDAGFIAGQASIARLYHYAIIQSHEIGLQVPDIIAVVDAVNFPEEN